MDSKFSVTIVTAPKQHMDLRCFWRSYVETMPKLLVLDVDGVMTDGTKMYGPDGAVIAKRFADADFTAIKKFQGAGWRVCWLSADETVNRAVAKERGIDFWYSREPDGTIDKVKWLHKLLGHYRTVAENVIYVGDDMLDMPIMNAVVQAKGEIYCPANAVPQVMRLVSSTMTIPALSCMTLTNVLGRRGGHGAIMELFHRLYPHDDTPPRH